MTTLDEELAEIKELEEQHKVPFYKIYYSHCDNHWRQVFGEPVRDVCGSCGEAILPDRYRKIYLYPESA